MAFQGLFHRVISESGTMLVAWALDREPVKHGRRIAEIAGCPLEPYADLLNCLRTIDAQELTDAFNLFVVSFACVTNVETVAEEYL